MTTPHPMPPADGDPEDFADRAPERVRDQAATDLGPPASDEDLDPADAERRLDQDHESAPNRTDPAYDADQDAAG